MNRRGQVFENPVSGERAVVLTDPENHPERVLVSHLYVEPGGRVAVAHRHPVSRERFRVIHGEVGFMIDGAERVLGPGEEAEVPPGALHDWWQVGEETAQVLVEVDPGDRFVEMVGTMFGLARDGKSDGKGLPRPLQLAVTVRGFRDVMVIASPPPWLQTLVFGILAPIARLAGRRPSYERYLTSEIEVEPEPEALAQLSADGRLRFGQSAPVS
jgi:mannose-6-phosphate isomerase-like protein (cupin superfamily)